MKLPLGMPTSRLSEYARDRGVDLQPRSGGMENEVT